MMLFKNQRIIMFQKIMMMNNVMIRRLRQKTPTATTTTTIVSVIGTAAFVAITTTSTLLLTDDSTTTTTTTISTTETSTTESTTASSSPLSLSLPPVSSSTSTISPSNCYCSCEASSSSSSITTSSSSSSSSSLSSSSSSSSSSSKLVFLGTGSSTGCPKPICIMENSPISHLSKCHVSRMAISGDPKHNKNYRNNPCLLIHHEGKNIMFDVGKTFREGAIRWMPTLDINTTGLDAVILTHHHMDAAAGLDDLRGFQNIQRDDDDNWSRIPIQVYMSQFCHSQLVQQFPWLFPKTTSNTIKTTDEEQTTPVVKRDVASLDVTIFENYQSFVIHGIKITPLPVWHGDDLICHGFVIEVPKNNNKSNNKEVDDDYTRIVYLSDISRMIPKTLQYIQNLSVDLFVCDSLLWHDNHAVHYSFDQAIELSQVIKPRIGTYTVGMNCDNYLPHDEMNLWLSRRRKHRMINNDDNDKEEEEERNLVQLAHDGFVIELR